MLKFCLAFNADKMPDNNKLYKNNKLLFIILPICIIMTVFCIYITKTYYENKDLIMTSITESKNPIYSLYSENLFVMSILVITLFISIIGVASMTKLKVKNKNDEY